MQEDIHSDSEHSSQDSIKHRGIIKKLLLISGIVLIVFLSLSAWLVKTRSGRSMIYKIASHFIHGNIKTEDVIHEYIPEVWNENIEDEENENKEAEEESTTTGRSENENVDKTVLKKRIIKPRQEDYVTNYLIFGVEEMKGARNTDSMLIASINIKDHTIKLTSLLRDTYIEIPEMKPMKLNAVYARGGAKLLVKTIEQNYRIKIDGYATINFNSFEKIVDRLGGITIELGEEEAEYLNTTNYISNKAYRNVKPGINKLNGNQVLGYCRIRRVETLGGTTDDYGRSLRHRRVLEAIFDRYKSQSIFKLLPIMNQCLGYVTTDLSPKQIERALEDVLENKISKMDTSRIPANNTFKAPDDYNGVTSPLVIDWDLNIVKLYQFIYLDTKEEAEAKLKTSVMIQE
ncbi:LCP family protein [Mobilitalea sibirica]|uniref:LCP family protein n=1 Tax=Mobilitalea sibirica TaxID=1462919 RepID=A0A8J7H270_9FIRM|nr:LCP family protein [Mobilitalea sibirica]MBH1940515.1 LCP family protein [Mobilitalea sibirica]